MSSAKFLRTFVASFIILVVTVYAAILLVDPYQNVPFSLPLDRAPISTNQRFAYPALARNPKFDSVIIGSSTLRLLNPKILNELTGARFANLSMNSATAYEQMRMHELFVRHHPDAKHVIIGIDDSWCRREMDYEKYTFRTFPEWMYDQNQWNDFLYMFNDKALENSVRLLEFIAGKRQSKYETDGYRDFTVDFGAYDLMAARKRLYPHGMADSRRVPEVSPATDLKGWAFAAHELLDKMLARSESRVPTMLAFAPMHGDYLANGEALYRECKGQILKIARARKAGIIDFMVDSVITRMDSNYWDPLHFRVEVARRLEADIATELVGATRPSEHYVTY